MASPNRKKGPSPGASAKDSEEQRKKDRRALGRRLDERRLAGIGEITPERRLAARRKAARRTRKNRRDRKKKSR